jgi:hypothetical protein
MLSEGTGWASVRIGMAGESNAAVRRVCRRINAFDEDEGLKAFDAAADRRENPSDSHS